MTASELKNLFAMQVDLQCKQERIEELQSLAERTTSLLQETPCAANASHSRLADIVLQLVSLKSQLELELSTLASLRLAAECEIACKIDDPLMRHILKARYLRAERWSTIIENCRLSRQSVFRLHRTGLLKLAQSVSPAPT